MDQGKGKPITNRIKVYGIVQGVGFRPLVYHIAKKYNIRGYVRNVGGYVEILAQAPLSEMERFLDELQTDHGNGSEIVKLEVEAVVKTGKNDVDIRKAIETDRIAAGFEMENIPGNFIIVDSKDNGEASILPPDLTICPECSREILDKADRRFGNPFISCTACGPRYTIIERLPYDREHTTMADFEMCGECHREYTSPGSRRHHAQTISCNDCGPYLIYREHIQDYVPEHTRHHAPDYILDNADRKHVFVQGGAAVCGDGSSIASGGSYELRKEAAFDRAAAILKDGGIIAVKGIGGYHFACSPFREETVARLRRLKGREEKPFAVMFGTMESIREYCEVSEEEEKLLQTNARPIVLLSMHKDGMASSTNRGSIYCGAFLPYTPLQILLTRACGPLIMTSGNLSGRPVIRKDQEMLELLRTCSPSLQGVLYHTRRIVRSVDDSVARMIDHKPQLIRRSRGYVPYPVFLDTEAGPAQGAEQENKPARNEVQEEKIRNGEQEDKLTQNGQREDKPAPSGGPVIFAAGGDLKAAYCLYRKGMAVVSQHFGDLEEETVLEEYIRSKEDLSGLLKLQPTMAVCDLHPNYHSVHFAKELGLPFLQVQHHHAHIASVMAEHGLRERVIGIALDGTGYGTDGCIWGGEFLICEGAEFQRAAHLAYTPILGGDGSVKDAKKTATCFLLHAGLEQYCEDDRAGIIKAALSHRVNTVPTSSMGRLFDAVASILNIGQFNRYEGECAAALEREAVLALRGTHGKHGWNNVRTASAESTMHTQCVMNEETELPSAAAEKEKTELPLAAAEKEKTDLHFAIAEKGEIMEIASGPLLRAICEGRKTKTTGELALDFHYAVADMLLQVSIRLRERYQTGVVALSGGVFQNAVLMERTGKLLRKHGFTVYYNLAVPPNDGGISLGQAYVGLMDGSLKRSGCD